MATFPIFRRGFVPPRKKQKFLVNENENKNENKIKYEKEGRKRSFQTSWLEEFSWLSYEEGRMKCKVCSAYDDSGPLVIGSTVFRKNCLQSHEKSDAHLKFVIIEKAKKNPSSTVAMRTLQHLNEMTVSQLKVKFRNTHFLCKQGRPFVDYPELCYLDEMKGIDVGNQYRSDKSAATFCHYIAEAERNKIRQNLEMSNFVSVISDGTTDSSFQETEIVYVRSCHKGKIDVYFSIVKNVPRGDSETIARVLVEGLEMLCPDYNSKLVGTGTDGASTMLGSKSGAVQRLRELTKRPYIVGIHCSGHKLELAFKDSLKAKIPLFNKVELLMINIYYFYRNSNVTRNGLKDSYRALGKKILLPTRVGGTRWLGHLEKSIQIYIKGYSAFVQHLGQLQNQDGFTGHSVKGNKAIHFYKASKSRDVWFMLHFLLDVLSILSSVSKTFQDRRADIQSILTEINMAITAIEKLETRDGFYMRKAISEPPSDLTGNEKGFISARKRLLSTIVDALHRRFTDNPGILAACSTLNLSVFPTKSDAEDYGDKDIDTLVDYFEPALSAAGVDVAAIASEWSKLKSHMLTRSREKATSLRPRPVTATVTKPKWMQPEAIVGPRSASVESRGSTASLTSILDHDSYISCSEEEEGYEEKLPRESEPRKHRGKENMPLKNQQEIHNNTYIKEKRVTKKKVIRKFVESSVTNDSEADSPEPGMSPWEQWLIDKAKEDREKRRAERQRKREEKRKKDEEEALKEKKLQQAELVRREWVEKKNFEETLKRKVDKQRQKTEKMIKEEQKKMEMVKAERKFEEWKEKKREEEKEKKKAEKQKQLEEERLRKEQRVKAQQKFEEWCKKADSRPKPLPNSFGYTSGKLTGYHDTSAYPVPTFYNPMPWQPIHIPRPASERKQKRKVRSRPKSAWNPEKYR